MKTYSFKSVYQIVKNNILSVVLCASMISTLTACLKIGNKPKTMELERSRVQKNNSNFIINNIDSSARGHYTVLK